MVRKQFHLWSLGWRMLTNLKKNPQNNMPPKTGTTSITCTQIATHFCSYRHMHASTTQTNKEYHDKKVVCFVKSWVEKIKKEPKGSCSNTSHDVLLFLIVYVPTESMEMTSYGSPCSLLRLLTIRSYSWVELMVWHPDMGNKTSYNFIW